MKAPLPLSVVPTVIICPGNGCTDILESNWYGYLHSELEERKIPSICRDFPDPYRARRDIWIPHIYTLANQEAEENGSRDVGAGKSDSSSSNSNGNIILVGHSSGAQAALRYCEQYPCRAVILISATYTDLGDAGERASGYYPQSSSSGVTNPYDFESMRKNCPRWYQFHSDDDPFIPLDEADRIRKGLGLKDASGQPIACVENLDDGFYQMLPGRSHFFRPPFPELLDLIDRLMSEAIR